MVAVVKAEDIKNLAEQKPFQPFVVRLVKGTQYSFKEAKEFGAPKDYHTIFFFGVTEAVRMIPIASLKSLNGSRFVSVFFL